MRVLFLSPFQLLISVLVCPIKNARHSSVSGGWGVITLSCGGVWGSGSGNR